MLTTLIGKKIEEAMKNLDTGRKSSVAKAALLGCCQGMIDFFEGFGILIWLICIYAAWVGRHGNVDKD